MEVKFNRLIWIFLFIKTVQLSETDNSPPTLRVNPRNLELEETTLVGSLILRAYANDNENDKLVFGLEAEDPRKPIPFRINTETGAVYLAQNLTGQAGRQLNFYVTVYDGSIPSKVQVVAKIVKKLSANPRLVEFSPVYFNNNYHQRFTYPQYVETTEETAVEKKKNEETVNPRVEESVVKDHEINEKLPKSGLEMTNVVTIVGIFAIFFTALIIFGVFRKKLWLINGENDKIKKGDEMKKDEISSTPPLEIDTRRFETNHPQNNSNELEKRDSHENELVESVRTRDFWEFERHKLVFLGVLGEGAFGQVWKCQINEKNAEANASAKTPETTKKLVAVKTLKENSTERDKADLLSELKVMKTLKTHPNIVKLLGCCTEKDPIFVIMEFVAGGKLQSFLRLQRVNFERINFGYDNVFKGSERLTSSDLTRMVYQVAKGMEFLEINGIIHRDLAARNVLITEDRMCKVADFGFARDVISTYVYERKSEGRLPIRWMAPESLYDNLFSSKSDVWSFGVLIWEVVTLGSTPYPGMSAQEVMKRVKEGYRLDKPEHCRRELYNIMYYCWNHDPKERPSFTECLELLDNLVTTETDYIELERFPDHSYYNVLSLSGEKL